MPRIHRPADANQSAPREFALLTQLKPDSEGNVSAETLKTSQKAYGDEKASFKDDITFEEFCALFAAPKTAVDGNGNTIGLAMEDKDAKFKPIRFDRRAVGDNDVRIQITHASICHSDIHTAISDWQGTKYPVVPGHEIVGIVTQVGSKVTNFKVGDRAGVGCMVNSCQSCQYCKDGTEQYCNGGGMVGTYNGVDRDGTITKGGYSTNVVVVDKYVLHIPDNLPLEGAAPLLCAGITVYSPLRFYGLDKPGMTVGVVGLGGLGAHAVKILKAFGCNVTVISRTAAKEEEAKLALGADHFLISKDEEAMKAKAGTLDGIINTVSAKHDYAPLLNLIKTGGKMVCVGAPAEAPQMPVWSMLMRRLQIGGSLIGGIKETQEMLDFCAEHNVLLPYETISADYVDTAYERVVNSDVRYRFVINIQGTLVQ